MSETVLTSRRARVRVAPRRWVPGRLRLSDRALAFASADSSVRIDIPLRSVASVRPGRAVIVVETAGTTVRIRCFGASGVGALLERFVG